MKALHQRIRKKLERELARIEAEIARRRAEGRAEELEAGGDNTPLSEEIDAAQWSEEVELQSELLHVLVKRAEGLRAALDRMREGTYGICEACGGPIPPKRLEAVPETLYCAPCQEKLEEEQARAGRRPVPAHWRRAVEAYEEMEEQEEVEE